MLRKSLQRKLRDQTFNTSFMPAICMKAVVAFLVVLTVYYMLRTAKSSAFTTDSQIPHLYGHNVDEWAKWNQAFDIAKFDLSDIHLLMSRDEIALFTRHVIACSKSAHCEYLEWGSGGSTQLVSKLMDVSQTNHINSIEHVTEWCGKMQSNALVKTAIADKKADFHCVDTGVKLREFGNPIKTDTETLDKMQGYINYVDKIEKKTSAEFLDLVLIDGRFRVACALKLILAKHIDRNSVVMVHDYTEPGRQYSIVERYYDKIDIASRLAVFQQKSVIDHERLQKDFDRFRYVVT